MLKTYDQLRGSVKLYQTILEPRISGRALLCSAHHMCNWSTFQE